MRHRPEPGPDPRTFKVDEAVMDPTHPLFTGVIYEYWYEAVRVRHPPWADALVPMLKGGVVLNERVRVTPPSSQAGRQGGPVQLE